MQKNHKACPKCGSEMHRQSSMCRNCYEEERAKPDSYITKECPVCSNEFTVHKAQIERGQGKYCSRSCARSGSPTKKRKRAMLECGYCGDMFEKHKSEIKKNVGDVHFCSPNCWYSYNQRENHYLWSGGQHERLSPEGREWRGKVIERDKGFCRICHSQENLEVHHIVRFGKNKNKRWDIDNGITLCFECHKKFRRIEEEYEDELELMASVPVVVWNV